MNQARRVIKAAGGGDLVRQRKVFEMTVRDMAAHEAELTIRAESGTYIKGTSALG